MQNQNQFSFRNTFFLMTTMALLLTLSVSTFSQSNQYQFNEVATTEAYNSSGYCRLLNYYWDQGLIDQNGHIYFIFVNNYKLFYYKSEDTGITWVEHQVITAQDGKIFNAMAALTQDNKLVITYAVNQGFNNGTVGSGSEFIYDLYGAIEGDEGWEFTLLKTHTNNSGLNPYGTITTKSGIVHIILSKNGWYNYGGELYEISYDPLQNKWSNIETIKIFNDRPVDRGTFHICKLAEGTDDAIICVYQRHMADTKYNNLEVITKNEQGWTEPEIILANSNYATYNRFDMDYDRHGHFYLGYFIPYGPNGPELYMAHNSTEEFTKYELFESTDTLRKMSIHPYPDAQAYVYLNFKNSYPKILHLTEDGLTLRDYLPEFEKEDSADVMRFHYQIPMKNNFSDDLNMHAFTNRYQGKDGNTVNPYPIVYVSTNLKKDITDIPDWKTNNHLASFSLYPNPGNGKLNYQFKSKQNSNQLLVYNSSGCLIKIIDAEDQGILNISHLPAGIYLIRDVYGNSAVRYIKK